ncbi:hypothetical protein GGP41_007753 [Bipolaris sorokiniana]|uniref:Uncharacterized protein n=1 Tax=Cochliobolus sativus TaxID=45130 RepID=A0A8H6DXS0_COCSA|nr:hypothetical protein GGP41_007753 [Bipolaris sorokiniana]
MYSDLISLHVWRKTLRGGMPAVLPPQQSQTQQRDAENLGIESLALELSLHFISSPISCGAVTQVYCSTECNDVTTSPSIGPIPEPDRRIDN